jgi:predicted transcriptional regulator
MTKETVLRIAALNGAAQTIDKLMTALHVQRESIQQQINRLQKEEN